MEHYAFAVATGLAFTLSIVLYAVSPMFSRYGAILLHLIAATLDPKSKHHSSSSNSSLNDAVTSDGVAEPFDAKMLDVLKNHAQLMTLIYSEFSNKVRVYRLVYYSTRLVSIISTSLLLISATLVVAIHSSQWISAALSLSLIGAVAIDRLLNPSENIRLYSRYRAKALSFLSKNESEYTTSDAITLLEHAVSESLQLQPGLNDLLSVVHATAKDNGPK